MYKWITHHLFLVILLFSGHPLHASTDHFWLLQEYGIEKRAMSDGALIQNFASLTKPLAFSVKPKQGGIWAIADGFLVSFDAEGNSINSVPLENINQNAYLVSRSKGGMWLFHADKRYSYSDELILEETLKLPVNGQQINDVSHHRRNGVTWLIAGQSAIAIDSEANINVHELEKNERIDAITTTRKDEIALLVSTPKAEFRLYTPEFEPIISHQLDEVTPSPDNIAVTKDGSFWITGKQHILLLDLDEGILINQQHNGDIPQGPGESQLVVNNNDNSAWVSTGRSLLHIDTTSVIQQTLMEPQRNIDLGSDDGFTSPPGLSPDSVVAEQFSYPPELFQSSGYTNNFLFRAGTTYVFSFDADDDDGDIDYSSFTASLIDTTSQIDISSPGTRVTPWESNFPLTCYRGSVIAADNPRSNLYPWLIGGSEDRITCHIDRILYLSPLSQGTTDEELQLYFHIFDSEGNESNRALASVYIDRTSPTFNPDQISIDIDNIKHTATISGTSGSVEPGSMIGLLYDSELLTPCLGIGCIFYHQARVKSTENGDFTITIQLDTEPYRYKTAGYGDIISIFAYDHSFNHTRSHSRSLGREIEISHASSRLFKHGGTITGTHSITTNSEGRMTASYSINGKTTYIPVAISGNTYTFTVSAIDSSYIENNSFLPILLEAREGNDAYGYKTV